MNTSPVAVCCSGLLLLLLQGCSDSPASGADGSMDGGSLDGGPRDSGLLDAADSAAADGAPVDSAIPPTLEETRIQPHAANGWFWQYEGAPVLLIGGTNEDNVFQIDGLEGHLDELAAAGGNYVRNTMSSRDEGDLYPFADAGDGEYDLSSWNSAYWDRFESFLRLTRDRDIIVQIEVWDRFDHSRDPWLADPYNPDNNINYTRSESGLAGTYPNHPGTNEQPFFHTVPDLDDNTVVRSFQEAFVTKMLSYTLEFGHVLYTMDNETGDDPAWGAYWAGYIRAAADTAGVGVETTEMWDDRNITASSQHRHTWDHPELYTFTDISQNNHQVGQTHWDQLQFVREHLSARPMPVNAVKIYGSDEYRYGTDADAIERFWRGLVGGMASSRFHRPIAGLGLSSKVLTQLRALRMVEGEASFFDLLPDQALLGGRSDNEAYVTASPGDAYIVYFTDGGQVTLDLSGQSGSFTLRWLSLTDATWGADETVTAGGPVDLQTSGPGGAVAVLVR